MNINEKPNYILKANEAAIVPKKNIGVLGKLRVAVWIIVGIILVASFIFQDNIFAELSSTSRIFLILLAVGTFFISTDERVPSPFEIWFFNDYLIIYRDKHYYTKKVTRRQYDKFYYKDIKQCQYRVLTQRINFYGIVEGVWYDYQKDGTLPQNPTYHKTTDSIRYFYTMFATDIDFVSEIESHSPIKVDVENS